MELSEFGDSSLFSEVVDFGSTNCDLFNIVTIHAISKTSSLPKSDKTRFLAAG